MSSVNVKLIARNKDLPVQAFMIRTETEILVIATDIWNYQDFYTEWMNEPRLPDGECRRPCLDLFDDENIWEFPTTGEGETAAHKKVCEIYAAELERYHKS